jgi:hypothetical protein
MRVVSLLTSWRRGHRLSVTSGWGLLGQLQPPHPEAHALVLRRPKSRNPAQTAARPTMMPTMMVSMMCSSLK